jgi:nitric oxide reductase activation protein
VQWRYPEWDERIARLRPDWCTVTEERPTPRSTGPVAAVDDVRALVAVLRRAARSPRLQPRPERDGETLDLDRALHAAVAARSGRGGEDRVYRRRSHAPAEAALFVLVDCSASSAQAAPTPGAPTRLAQQQQATARLSRAAQAAGWRVAVQGFCSDGRHGVRQWRVQDVGEPWSDAVAARLASLHSDRSTRLGAALRHATRALAETKTARKLVLVMTDGEPHDVDVHDPRYLTADARHAVRTAERCGVRCACLLFDAEGAAAVEQMFGPGRSALLREAAGLPALLSRLLDGAFR